MWQYLNWVEAIDPQENEENLELDTWICSIKRSENQEMDIWLYMAYNRETSQQILVWKVVLMKSVFVWIKGHFYEGN